MAVVDPTARQGNGGDCCFGNWRNLGLSAPTPNPFVSRRPSFHAPSLSFDVLLVRTSQLLDQSQDRTL